MTNQLLQRVQAQQGITKPKNQAKRKRARRAFRNALGGGGNSNTPTNGTMSRTAVSFSQHQGSQAPQLSGTGSRGGDLRVRIRHREYIAEATGSAAYAATAYSVNPGVGTTFPWLSQMAGLFESYLFNSLKFQYRTEAATSAAGKALLSVDWDAADATPTSKILQLQERTKADDAVWQNFDLPCDVADLRKNGQRYIRTGSLAANLDIKTYDVGTFVFGTQGSTGAIGELWVEYDVELITPNSSANPSAGSAAKIVGATSISTAQIFGTNPTITQANNLPITVSANTITFNATGSFLIETVRGGTTVVAMTAAASPPTVSVTAMAADTPNAAATLSNGSWKIVVTAPGQSIIFTSTDATTTACTARISQYSLT